MAFRPITLSTEANTQSQGVIYATSVPVSNVNAAVVAPEPLVGDGHAGAPVATAAKAQAAQPAPVVVVAVAPQPAGSPYTGATVPSATGRPQQQPNGVLPNSSRENQWNVNLCDRCCDCTANCWMAWCCACVPVAQMVEKMRLAGQPVIMNCTYSGFITAYFAGLLVFLVVMSTTGIRIELHNIILAVTLYHIRGAVRRFYNINGSGCEDCLATVFCGPCTVIQLVTQMWSRPNENPGCDCSARAAMIV